MEKVFIGKDDKRSKYLKLKYAFRRYKMDRNNKNLIEKISKHSSSKSVFLVSEGLFGYYTYFASGLMNKCEISIVINPIFFTKRGTIVSPSYDIINDNISKNFVILHKDLPFLKETIKLLESNGNKYEVVDNTSDSVVGEIINKYTKVDGKNLKKWKLWG